MLCSNVVGNLNDSLFYEALGSLPQVIGIIDAHYRLVYVNNAYQLVVGQEEGIIGNAFWKYFPNEKNPSFLNKLSGSMRMNRSFKMNDYHFRLKNGSDTWWNIRFLPLQTSTIHFMIVADECTEMYQASEKNEKEQTKRNFVQIAAHELRTPITVIKGFAQLIVERFKERKKKWFFQPTLHLMDELQRDEKYFKVIWDEVVRVDELTDELLSIFRMDQGLFELDVVVQDVVELVQRAVDEYTIPDTYHRIHFEANVSDLHVTVDTAQIRRVIHNLLSNAVKYSPDATNVWVRIGQIGNRVEIAVTDEGIGIPEKDQPRIFERFYRAVSPEHEHVHGYGIGLHICQEIVRQHGGDITFESEYHRGSTFYVRLPITWQH